MTMPKSILQQHNEEMREELYEKLADIEHQRWADWQSYCHSKILASLKDVQKPKEFYDLIGRWGIQINTPYERLSEKEKDSDREQVDRYWHLIEAQNKVLLKKVRGSAKETFKEGHGGGNWRRLLIQFLALLK